MLELLSQFIVTEPQALFVAGSVMAGLGWCLKKLYDVDRRLIQIETRCRLICKFREEKEDITSL